MEDSASLLNKGSITSQAILIFILLLFRCRFPFRIRRNSILWRTIGPVAIPGSKVGNGHSLLAVQAIARIAADCCVRLTPHHLLFNTLEQIAPLCKQEVNEATDSPSKEPGTWLSRLIRLRGKHASP